MLDGALKAAVDLREMADALDREAPVVYRLVRAARAVVDCETLGLVAEMDELRAALEPFRWASFDHIEETTT